MVKRLWPLVALLACENNFEKASIVIDLRVLAVRADPPEVVADVDPKNPGATQVPPVRFTALVADPKQQRRLAFTYDACPVNPASFATERCDNGQTVVVRFGSGTIDDPEAPGVVGPVATLQADANLILAAIRADPLRGFGGVPVQIELTVRPEGTPENDPQTVYAAKVMVYAPRVPAERVANQNPSLARIEADGVAWDGGRCDDPAAPAPPLSVTPEQEIHLAPVETPGARETYVLPTFDGGSRTFTENLRYAFFASDGVFSSETTGGPKDNFGNEPLLDTRWAAPKTEGQVRFWLVQRDERGGTYWTERCFLVKSR